MPEDHLNAVDARHLVDSGQLTAVSIHLLIEDQGWAEQLQTVLYASGYQVCWIRSASFEPSPSGEAAILLADLDDAGPHCLREIRRLKTLRDTMIIALVTSGSAQTVQACLDAGVDDFVFKPIRLEELQARILITQSRGNPAASRPGSPLVDRRRGERRRGWLANPPRHSQSAAFQIDLRGKQVLVDGKPAMLSPKEFKILELLASDPGRVFSNQELITHAWPKDRNATAEDVQQYIYLLRSRIGSRWVRTVKGFGYALALNPALDAERTASST